MTRLHEPNANPYDVLGVSPNESAEEIDSAFHRLIEGGGYRIGVPLRGQWQRAREIKQAYAIIGDPAKRRAYDESLAAGVSEEQRRRETTDREISGGLWPAAANDPATDALVRPVKERQPPPALEANADAHGPADGESVQAPQIGGAAEDKIAPLPEKRPARSRKGSTKEQARSDEGNNPAVPEPAPSSSEPDQAPAAAIASGTDESVPPEEDVPLNDDKRHAAKIWGSAAAAALALGSLVYFAWPGGEPQLSGPRTATTSAAEQAALDGPKTKQLAPLPPVVPSGEEQAEAPGAAIPPPPASVPFVAIPGAIATDAPTGAKAPIETQGQSRTAVAASSAAAASAAPPSRQASTGGPPAAAGAPAPALARPQPAAAASSTPTAAATEARSPAAARPAASVVRVQPQWLSGGPTAKDNRRGRYKGTVIVQFTVQADGRAANCSPVRGSGNADLDALTCRLVEERSRFKPAVDAQGRAVATQAHATYEWGRRHRPFIPTVLSKIF